MNTPLSRRAITAMGFGALTALSATTLIRTARKTPEPPEIPEALTASLDGIPEGLEVAAAVSHTETPEGLAVALDDIPVGGAKIVLAHQVVVTRSNEETFHALHTKCPHDNCDIGDVRNEAIICFCHGSQWELSGKLKRGPARKSLGKREHEIIAKTLYVTDVDPADLVEHGDSAIRVRGARK